MEVGCVGGRRAFLDGGWGGCGGVMLSASMAASMRSSKLVSLFGCDDVACGAEEVMFGCWPWIMEVRGGVIVCSTVVGRRVVAVIWEAGDMV